MESSSSEPAAPVRPRRRGLGALAVASGILFSRVAGLVRTSVLASIFGVGAHADVWSAALRLPNLLQNLLGEQTLSAAFIPVYSRLLGAGRKEEAGRFAGAVFSLLAALAGGAALVGVLLARPIVALFAPGFLGDQERIAQGLATVDRYQLAVLAVRWIFPMSAILVLSAWALGVLNSHRRFFLSYVAPVVWNASIIAAVWWVAAGRGAAPGGGEDRLLVAACAGALAGGLLQFLIQIPGVIRDLEGFRFGFRLGNPAVREAIAAFLPTVAGRGAVQFSSYIDQLLASWLVAGAIGALAYAQTLYLLPVSLFGLSLAAAALPDLARQHGEGRSEAVERDLRRHLMLSSFLNLPASVAYLLLGLPLVQGIFQLFGRRFGAEESWLVYAVLAAYALGLPAATQARVLQSGLYAGGDARSPARYSVLRVSVGAALGIPLMLSLDRFPVSTLWARSAAVESSTLHLGALGLALAASFAAWVEWWALRRKVLATVRGFRWPAAEFRTLALWAVAAAVLPLALVASRALAGWHPSLRALLVGTLFGGGYLFLTRRSEPAQALRQRFGKGARR
ncbi:MAG: murein biosynthesis integral membrane protein MurJ [Thermoanaerobaculia bacterium]